VANYLRLAAVNTSDVVSLDRHRRSTGPGGAISSHEPSAGTKPQLQALIKPSVETVQDLPLLEALWLNVRVGALTFQQRLACDQHVTSNKLALPAES
jgi:hypothetical protein